MSRVMPTCNDHRTGFPRVSGDEPHDRVLYTAQITFSPRERG